MDWLLIGLGVALAVYLALIAALLLAGRRVDAAALARFIPDCLVLMKRLLGDAEVPRRRKVVLAALVVYLLIPIDLVPDFIPVLGYADDVIVVAATLRSVVRGAGADLVRQHWPGTKDGLAALWRLARLPGEP
jgi:uncharacterized membrane protein YkvA (DUF1232 family)